MKIDRTEAEVIRNSKE